MDKIDEDRKTRLTYLKDKVAPQIEKLASINYHRRLLRQWLFSIIFVAVGASLGLVLHYMHLLPSNVEPLTESQIENMARSIIAPSITMNGLFITFVPVISFFYMAEIKEDQERNEREFRTDTKEFSGEEDKKVILSLQNSVHAFWHNFRVGILRYTQSYLMVSLLSLIVLLILYIGLNPAQFIIADIILLIVILAGIFPIIRAALNEPLLEPYSSQCPK